jgi:hypothetical protein
LGLANLTYDALTLATRSTGSRRILSSLDRYALVAFLAEARRQAAYAELAASDLDQAIKDQNPDRLWLSIHVLLVAIGNVSKLLWPNESKPGQRPRGLILRAILGVPESSPLRDRKFRDIWEHYDKYLDRWARLSRSEPAAAEFVGPTSRFPHSERFMRLFGPDTWTVELDGERYQLRPPLEAIRRLRQVAEGRGYELASGVFDLDKVERGVRGKINEMKAARLRAP